MMYVKEDTQKPIHIPKLSQSNIVPHKINQCSYQVVIHIKNS